MKKLTRILAGFTAIEILLTIGTIAISSGMAVPVYRQYIVRNDLEIARQNVAQGLQRAKFLSQVAMNDSEWGFSTNEVPGRGVLFMGSSYALRDTDFDELYSVPNTVTVSGVTEVTFSKIDGSPNQTGEISLQALTGDTRVITVSLGSEGNLSIPEDSLNICHDPSGTAVTMLVNDAQLEIHLDHGDAMGECGTASSSSAASSSSSSAGSCPAFTLESNNYINPADTYGCRVDVVGTNLDYAGSYDMPITYRLKINSWTDIWDEYSKATSGNINPNCLGDEFGGGISGGSGSDSDSKSSGSKSGSKSGSESGSESTSGSSNNVEECGYVYTYYCPSTYAGSKNIQYKAKSWIKKKSWYTGHSDSNWKKKYEHKSETGKDSDYVRILKDGDAIPADIDALNSSSTIQSYLAGYVDLNSGQMSMGECEALVLYEFDTSNLDSSDADFQDLVIKVTLSDSAITP